MKTTAPEEKTMRGTDTVTTKHDNRRESTELRTDYPLSEKDEVKLAESKMRNARKKLL